MSLHNCCMRDGFLAWIISTTLANLCCVSSSSATAILFLNLMCYLTLFSSSIKNAALKALTFFTVVWLIDIVSDLAPDLAEPFLDDATFVVLTEKICWNSSVAELSSAITSSNWNSSGFVAALLNIFISMVRYSLKSGFRSWFSFIWLWYRLKSTSCLYMK